MPAISFGSRRFRDQRQAAQRLRAACPGGPGQGAANVDDRPTTTALRSSRQRRLVDEDGNAVTNRCRAHEAQALLVAGLAEEAPTCPEDDREDHQAQLVDEIVLDQRLHKLGAAMNHDVSLQALPQFRDLLDYVALEQGRVVPLGFLER